MLALRNSVNFVGHDAARRIAATNDHAFGSLQMGRAGAAARSRPALAAFRRRSSGRHARCLKA